MRPTYLDELRERRRAETERESRQLTDAADSLRQAIPEACEALLDLAASVRGLTR